MAPFIYWEFLAACLGMSVRSPGTCKQRPTSGPNMATSRLRPAAGRHCHLSSLHFQTNARGCRFLDSLGGEKARRERPPFSAFVASAEFVANRTRIRSRGRAKES